MKTFFLYLFALSVVVGQSISATAVPVMKISSCYQTLTSNPNSSIVMKFMTGDMAKFTVEVTDDITGAHISVGQYEKFQPQAPMSIHEFYDPTDSIPIGLVGDNYKIIAYAPNGTVLTEEVFILVVEPEIIFNPILNGTTCLTFDDLANFSLNLEGLHCVEWDFGDGTIQSGLTGNGQYTHQFNDNGHCNAHPFNKVDCFDFTVTATILDVSCGESVGCPKRTLTQTIEVCCSAGCPTGTNPNPFSLAIQLSPNPTGGTVWVTAEDLPADETISVNVVSVTSGTPVFSVSNISYSGTTHTLPIDLSQQPPGQYSVQVQAGAKSGQGVVIKQ